MAEVIELENLPTSWTLLRSSSYWKTDYGCKPLWGPPGLEKTQPGLGSDGGVESHTSFSGQLPSVPDQGGQGEEGLVGAALASVKLGWRCGRKGGWGGTRKPQTTLMWVDEFRPDLVVMLLCSLHQDHSWSPCGFEKV